jgi:2-oxoglutarate dehydrogenase E2 component (dihydrolipoamide succinyltransferase)
MGKIEIIMPKMGESITEATITKWLKQPGDKVEEEDGVAEIATDKVDSEIPAPVDGVISELLFEEGDIAQVGQAIAVLEAEANEKAEDTNDSPPKSKSKEVPVENIRPESREKNMDELTTTEALPLKSKGPSGRFYSPLVRNIAREENVSMDELEAIPGSGKDNRLIKQDLLDYLENRKTRVGSENGSPAFQTGQAVHMNDKQTTGKPVLPAAEASAGDEVIEMNRMRRLIADHMVASEDTSVHVTSFMEVDITNLVNWRNKYKKDFEKREGAKLTFTPIFIAALVKAIRDFPMINSSVSGNKIIIRKNINIGMATALPDGNLIVPVIKRAGEMNLVGIAKKVNDLALRARNNKLQPEEIQDGTFTLTNVGTFDTLFATPIINQPQVAILAAGAVKKKPVVMETEQGDVIAIRHMMYLSMSYDHRVIDGALGGMMLQRIGQYLQEWDTSQSI